MSEYHRFSVDAATEYGVVCALLLEHIKHWVSENRANGVNRHNGKYWMYKSVKGFSMAYPYFTENQIRRALEKMRNDGLIVTGRFSTGECTRMLWYTLTKKGQALVSGDCSDLASVPNRNGTSAKSVRQESQNDTASVPKRYGNDAISSIDISKEQLIETINKEKKEREKDAPGVDAGWTEFVREYGSNIGLLPTSTVERGDLEMFYTEFGVDVLREIIHYTARKHPDNPHVYFAKLCRNWLGKGIKTAEQAKAAFKDYERKRDNRRRQDATSGEYAAPEDVFG